MCWPLVDPPPSLESLMNEPKAHRSDGPVRSSMAARIRQVRNAVWCPSNGLKQPLAKKFELLQNERIFILLFTTEWFEININAIAYYLWKGMQNAHLHRKDVFNTSFNTYIYNYISLECFALANGNLWPAIWEYGNTLMSWMYL